ncbi:MAG: EpsG family protein [Lachnospiraceae bacterium]|nr:EpsG family protein [Lachnospiraceae bacterium]
MVIYYVALFVLAAFGILAEQKQKSALYLSFSFLLLVFVASFRYAIGFDYFSYLNIYETTSLWSFKDIFQFRFTEPLFFVVCKLCSLAGCSYPVFLVFLNLFLIGVPMWFIRRYSRLPWVSVYLFICLQFLAHDMNLLRQSIAVCFFLLAYPYLKNRKLLPFTLLILAGGLFHNSLFFIFPLYFLLPQKLSRKCLAALLFLTAGIYFFFDPLFLIIYPFLPAKYTKYMGSYYWTPNSFFYLALPTLYCLLIYLFRKRIADPCQRTIYLNCALYNCLINLFITKHFILERFAVYPFIIVLTAIPEIIDSCRMQDRNFTAPQRAACSRSADWRNFLRKKKENGGKPILTYHRTLLLFLAYGMVYFIFAAAQGYHYVYPYVSLLDQSFSTPN